MMQRFRLRSGIIQGRNCAPQPLDALYPGSNRRHSLILAVMMLAVTVLQRFAVPGTGNIVGIGFALGVGVTFIGLMRRTLRVDPNRVVLYVIAISGLLLTLLIKSSPDYSLKSFFMLAVMYIPFVAMMGLSREEYRSGLKFFQIVMALSAAAGLLQLLVQAVGRPELMFPLDNIIPKQFLISNFNLRIPVSEGSHYLKSTGLIFLEPSHFSQFIGLSILIELVYFRNWGRLVILLVAYATSFSGSGLILLLLAGIPLIFRTKQYWILLLIAAGILLLPWLRDTYPFSVFFARMGGFGNPMGSGSMRFFGPYWLVGDLLLKDPGSLLFGYGPGNVIEIESLVDYAVQDTSWLKLLVEYGLVGCISFLPLYLYVLFANSPDRLISFACLAQFLLLGGFLNSFYVQFLHLALIGWPRLTESPRAPQHWLTPVGGVRSIQPSPGGA